MQETTSNSELMTYNKMGLIPGPDETEEDFLKRVQYCLNLKENLASHKDLELPEEIDLLSKELSNEFTKITLPLFDITPTWIPIIFSNQKLTPWHGGCAWIFQLTEETPMAAFFQLRRHFKNNKRYLGIYDRSELLAHESAHVGRMMFEEPRFEEILAFRTSSSFFRRWFGPIVQAPWEGMLFLFSLFICIIMQFFLIAYDLPLLSSIGIWSIALPAGLLLVGLIRLVRRHQQFNACLSRLKKLSKNEKNANAIIFRLLDQEIEAFSSMSPEEIFNYSKSQKSLRWKLISYYLNN